MSWSGGEGGVFGIEQSVFAEGVSEGEEVFGSGVASASRAAFHSVEVVVLAAYLIVLALWSGDG